MHWSLILAKKIIADKSEDRHYFIQRICQIAIALCLTTILLASFLIRGFESKIEEKIFQFWSHIRISPLSNSINPLAEKPLNINIKEISHPSINQIIPVANKGVILKSKENIEGIVLKGIPLKEIPDKSFLLPNNLTYDAEKEIPIVLSHTTLNNLNTRIGKTILLNIIDSHPITLKAKIINSYHTNIEEFDAQVALSELNVIQKLNRWLPNEYSWIELKIKDKESISTAANNLYETLDQVNVETIDSIFPQLFDWLSLMKRNELIILIVMSIVAMVNIISTISIFIIEKTKLIGILKVLGSRTYSIHQLLLFQIFRIILIGIFWGNILTFILTAIIYYLKPIHLDPKIYYVSYTPIQFDIFAWIGFNLLTIFVCIMSAWIPLLAVSKISPVKIVEYN